MQVKYRIQIIKIWYCKLNLHFPGFIVINPMYLTCRYRDCAFWYTDYSYVFYKYLHI